VNSLLAQRFGEVTVVRNDEYTTLKDLERLDKSSERLAIKVICDETVSSIIA
jgi:hypothetical protein